MVHQPDELIPTRWSLIGRLKNWDDQVSWREFFDTYWRLIYGAGLRSGLTPAEAEEVVQETVISVAKSMPKFKADPAAGSFKAWLLTLTRWRIADQVRKRPREEQGRVHRSPDQHSTDTASTATEERIPDPAGNVLDVFWEEEWERKLMAAALDKLRLCVNAKHFQVFYLNAIKGISPEKVAKALSIKVDQVYVIKQRLSQQLREIIQELETKVS